MTPNGFQDWTTSDREIFEEHLRTGEPFSKLWREYHESRTRGIERESLLSIRKVGV